MRDHPVRTPGASDRRPSMQPFESPFDAEFALYDMLKFRASVDYDASQASSATEPPVTPATPAAQSTTSDTSTRTRSTNHVSFAASTTSLRSSPTASSEAPTAAGMLGGARAGGAKPMYLHPFAVPDPRGDPRPHERLELENPHPFALAEGIARSLSAPPPPAPPPSTPVPSAPPSRAPSLAPSLSLSLTPGLAPSLNLAPTMSRVPSRDDTDALHELQKQKKTHHHHNLDALLRAKMRSRRLIGH